MLRVAPRAGAADAAKAFNGAGRATMIVAVALVGAAAAHHAGLMIAAFAVPILLAFVVTRPEWILILFLTAGIYKQDPRLTSFIPFDVTMLLGALLGLALAFRIARHGARIPPQALLLLPLVVMLVHGLLGRAPDYGHEKASRFCTLTILAILASGILFEERKSFERFLIAIAVIGFGLSLDALGQRNVTSEGRLTGYGGNPIPLARIGALTLAYGWVRFHFAQRAFERVLYGTILAISCVCVIGAGSRGPVLAIVLGMILVSVFTMMHHRRSPIGATTLVLIGGFVALAILFAAIPSLPLHRFQLLFSEDKGTSVFLRGMLMATAAQLTLTHPFGLGVGGFARHSLPELLYPHNLFLEVGSELGWIPLICLMVLMGWSVATLFQILRREYSWSAIYLALVVLVPAMNSMVTGDLNDNRILFAVLLLPFVYRRTMAPVAHGGCHTRGRRA